MNNKFKKIVAVLAALAILTSGWYFFYWLKTPQHSIALIADAVRQHDLKTFEKHVDMDNLYSKAYDDVVAVTFGSDKDANPIIVAIVKGIKGLAVPLLPAATLFTATSLTATPKYRNQFLPAMKTERKL